MIQKQETNEPAEFAHRAASIDDGAWLHRYGGRLNSLYELTTELPSDLQQLVDQLGRRMDD